MTSVAWGAYILRERMTAKSRRRAAGRVQSSVAVASGLDAAVARQELTQEQAIARLREIVHKLRIDHGNGYITVNDFNGLLIG